MLRFDGPGRRGGDLGLEPEQRGEGKTCTGEKSVVGED